MTPAYALLLIVTAGTITAQTLIAARFNVVSRILIYVVATYFALSYVARPLYLTTFMPEFGQPLYDPRLFATGYAASLNSAGWIVLVGLVSFLVGLIACTHIARRIHRSTELPLRNEPVAHGVYSVLLAIAWAGRLVTLIAGPSSLSVVAAVGLFAPALWMLTSRLRTRLDFAALILVALGEVAWSGIDASKTPILTFLAAAIMRFSVSHGIKRLAVALPVVVAFTVATFAAIQPLKGIDTTSNILAQNSSALQAVSATVLQRTDTLTTVIDAMYFPNRPWLSLGDYLNSMITGFLPTGLHQSVGLLWTTAVKTASFAQQFQGVYIATGTTAEGYAQLGMPGVVIENFILAIIVLALGLGLNSRRIWLVCFCSAFAFDASLYEGGLLQIAEVGSGAIQTTLIVIVLSMLIKALGSVAPSSPTTRLAPKPQYQSPSRPSTIRRQQN
ncbi:hypothetical protein [Amnibacterium kyonggiense]|uniref:Oligosaccharide repeat unit polymerase n=1 Tax=Amnibacterium kyonggiense TaxID=595671 RepID=A0A4R7FHT4_9MICO|nr:hypothetical protein [Amnibacterium kyonggiense]TDS74907.1 hypothetical protein CLV52_3429 [Amnibacterium kyonggiense]